MNGIAVINATGINNVNDAAAGGAYSAAEDGGVGRFPGQVGQTIDFRTGEVISYDSTIGVLYSGRYQYVKFKAGTTLAPTKGLVCYWDPDLPGQGAVTMDAPTVGGSIAGVCLNSVTKGNYGFIQVSGVATVLCKASSLTRTAAVGIIGIAVTAAGTVDTTDTNDAVTGATEALVVGSFIELPVAGSLKLLNLFPHRFIP